MGIVNEDHARDAVIEILDKLGWSDVKKTKERMVEARDDENKIFISYGVPKVHDRSHNVLFTRIAYFGFGSHNLRVNQRLVLTPKQARILLDDTMTRTHSARMKNYRDMGGPPFPA